MAQGSVLVYGANGFTGKLIVEEALRRGIRPVVAGRREEPIEAIAREHGLEYEVFGLDSADALTRQFESFTAVILAAGPFSKTSAPVVEACLRSKTHYLDITGELEVFEAVLGRDGEARRAGVTLLPGVGFDVVPTDCLAAVLKEALPEATHLELAFRGIGEPSRGTMKTTLENLPKGGAVRVNGAIVRVPAAYRVKEIPFRDQPLTAVTIPWGDISTAYHSTGIPNIEVYMAMPPRAIRAVRRMRPILPLLGAKWIQKRLASWAERNAKGPSADELRSGKSQLWGRVEDRSGRSVEATLVTPEGYRLTALTTVEAARRLLEGSVDPGALTPSRAFGAHFIETIAGTDLRVGAIA